MFGVLCIVVGILFLSCLISIAIKEDNKNSVTNCDLPKTNSYDDKNAFKQLMERLEVKFDKRPSHEDEIIFKELRICSFHSDKYLSGAIISFKSGYLSVVNWGHIDKCEGDVLKHLEQNYSQYAALKERCYYFLSDILKEATFQQSAKSKIEEVYKLQGFCKGEERFKSVDGWISINDGEYYACSIYGIHKLEDWSYIYADEAWEIIKDAKLEKSDNPKKIHWEHFLRLEMLAKKKREKDMQEFVDGVLSKQVKYNDLQLQYEMLPTAPITDIETFLNFCKIVKEDVNYEPHEIQNYLFMKKLK